MATNPLMQPITGAHVNQAMRNLQEAADGLVRTESARPVREQPENTPVRVASYRIRVNQALERLSAQLANPDVTGVDNHVELVNRYARLNFGPFFAYQFGARDDLNAIILDL